MAETSASSDTSVVDANGAMAFVDECLRALAIGIVLIGDNHRGSAGAEVCRNGIPDAR